MCHPVRCECRAGQNIESINSVAVTGRNDDDHGRPEQSAAVARFLGRGPGTGNENENIAMDRVAPASLDLAGEM